MQWDAYTAMIPCHGGSVAALRQFSLATSWRAQTRPNRCRTSCGCARPKAGPARLAYPRVTTAAVILHPLRSSPPWPSSLIRILPRTTTTQGTRASLPPRSASPALVEPPTHMRCHRCRPPFTTSTQQTPVSALATIRTYTADVDVLSLTYRATGPVTFT